MSKHVISEDALPTKIHLVAGVDVAYVRDLSVGAVAVLKYETRDFLESKTALCKTRIPYIPTLLSFREVWPVTSSIDKLEISPMFSLSTDRDLLTLTVVDSQAT